MIDINGRLHSTEKNVNVIAGADEILDDSKNKKQSEINTETYALVNDVNERLSGLSPDQQSALSVAAKATNNEIKLGYYVCGTEGNVAAKIISDATGYVLSTGGSIKVKMTNVNTANNATLNINSTGVKPLYYDGERASANNTWEAGETVEVYYDGTNFYANNVAGGGGDGVFDVSEKYPTSGVEGGNTYTLDGALAVLNANLPTSKKKGGMSIKFVQSSDNKYVQYRLMANQWSTTVSDWQGVDDEPTANSKNLVESDGVAKELFGIRNEIGCALLSDTCFHFVNHKNINDETGVLETHQLIISLENYVEITGNKIIFEDHSTTEGRKLVYSLGYYRSDKSFIERTSASDATVYTPVSDAKYFRVAISLYINNVSVGGEQADYELDKVNVYSDKSHEYRIKANEEDITSLKENDTSIEGNITNINKSIKDIEGVITSINFGSVTWNAKKGVDPSNGGLINNGDITTSNFIRIPSGCTKVEFVDNIARNGGYLVYCLSFYSDNKQSGFMRRESGYIKDTIHSIDSGAKYLRVSLVLKDSNGTTIVYDNANYHYKNITLCYQPSVSDELHTIKENYIGIHEISINSTDYWRKGVIATATGDVLSNDSTKTCCSELLRLDRSTIVSYTQLVSGKTPVFYTYCYAVNGKYLGRATGTGKQCGLNSPMYMSKVLEVYPETVYVRLHGTMDFEGDPNNVIAWIEFELVNVDDSNNIIFKTHDDVENIKPNVATLLEHDNSYGKSEVYPYGYYGAPIRINPRYRYKKLAEVGEGSSYRSSVQGGAVYGNYLFQFHGQDATENNFRGVEIFNLSTQEKVQEIDLGGDDLKHNNSVTFGTEKYSQDDYFPLLYASQLSPDARYCLVYRITGTEGSFVLTLVQVISFPSYSVLSITTPNCFVCENGKILILGPTVSGGVATLTSSVHIYPLPSVSEGTSINIGEVVAPIGGTPQTVDGWELSTGNKVKRNTGDTATTIKEFVILQNTQEKTFTFNRKTAYEDSTLANSYFASQGGVVFNEMFYALIGSEGSSHLKVIDLNKEEIVSVVKFSEITELNKEPEAAWIFNNSLGVTYNSSGKIILFDFM